MNSKEFEFNESDEVNLNYNEKVGNKNTVENVNNSENNLEDEVIDVLDDVDTIKTASKHSVDNNLNIREISLLNSFEDGINQTLKQIKIAFDSARILVEYITAFGKIRLDAESLSAKISNSCSEKIVEKSLKYIVSSIDSTMKNTLESSLIEYKHTELTNLDSLSTLISQIWQYITDNLKPIDDQILKNDMKNIVNFNKEAFERLETKNSNNIDICNKINEKLDLLEDKIILQFHNGIRDFNIQLNNLEQHYSELCESHKTAEINQASIIEKLNLIQTNINRLIDDGNNSNKLNNDNTITTKMIDASTQYTPISNIDNSINDMNIASNSNSASLPNQIKIQRNKRTIIGQNRANDIMYHSGSDTLKNDSNHDDSSTVYEKTNSNIMNTNLELLNQINQFPFYIDNEELLFSSKYLKDNNNDSIVPEFKTNLEEPKDDVIAIEEEKPPTKKRGRKPKRKRINNLPHIRKQITTLKQETPINKPVKTKQAKTKRKPRCSALASLINECITITGQHPSTSRSRRLAPSS